MMIAEQRINNCSLFRMMVVCSSIMVFFRYLTLSMRHPFLFSQSSVSMR